MTVFEKFKSMNIDEFTEWIDKYGAHDSPWVEWFEKTYCYNCPSEQGYMTDNAGEYEWSVPCEYGWCELNDFKCKFFPDMEEAPDNKDMIKLWLKSEAE